MNKAELVEAIASKADLTKTQATDAVEGFIEAVIKTLKKGERVTLVGFGTFSVNERNARNGRNPQTGETIKIEARKIPKFKPGTEFSNKIGGKK